jgi:hypothetical protein
MTILECPHCFSHRVAILDTKPPSARCADCKTTYVIKHTHIEANIDGDLPQQSSQKKRKKDDDELPAVPAVRPTPSELGPLTEYVEASIQGGPNALRAAQKEANRLAKKFGIDFETQWLLKTPWLEAWARGEHPVSQRHPNATVVQLGSTASRLRVRAMMATRARFLTFLAVLGSRYAACRKAKVSHQDINYHLDNDPDFAAQAEIAKAYFTDLLHTRAMQRAIEGDCEPVYWQGIEVGHVRKFDSRLQIEMLRAHMPDKFKTPGTGAPTTINGDVLVLTEEARAKLIQANRERIMALPENFIEGEFERVVEDDKSEPHEPQ